MSTLTFVDSNFDERVLRSDRPVLVDFWAQWCGPCHVVGPTVDAVAEQLAGRAHVGKVNVDDDRDLARRYGIKTIPTLLLFDRGVLVGRHVGIVSRAELLALVEPYVSPTVAAGER